MPIDPNCYYVKHDGRIIHRGLSEREAYGLAKYDQENLDRRCASSKRRTPCIEVGIDRDLVKQDDELYKHFKRGG